MQWEPWNSSGSGESPQEFQDPFPDSFARVSALSRVLEVANDVANRHHEAPSHSDTTAHLVWVGKEEETLAWKSRL